MQHFECNNDEILVLSQQKHMTLEIEPRDFLKILAISASFSYKHFSYKKTCNHPNVHNESEYAITVLPKDTR